MKLLLFVLVIFTLKKYAAFAQEIEPSEDFQYVEYLDPKRQFRMFWKINNPHITFELHVQTTGWIGIGISPNGKMANSDIVVGWVKDGRVHLTDRFSPPYGGYPPMDREENVELLAGRECDGFTIIKFRRQLAACEDYHDRPITDATMRMLYAFGVNDPRLSDLFFTDKHRFENRGSKSVLLLAKQPAQPREVQEDPSLETLELRNDGIEFPVDSTYYKCRLLQLPIFPSKRHIIKMEAIIDQENLLNVHHMLLYYCPPVLKNTNNVGRSASCYLDDALPEASRCQPQLMYGWAVGSGPTFLPDKVGLPIGVPGEPTFILLETHYDNPAQRVIRDTSGVKFTYTSKLRVYDAGIAQVGSTFIGLELVVPPNMESFQISGDCDNSCLDLTLDQAGIDHINLTSVLLHSHLAGRKMKLRHVRNGTELPPIADDQSYDFDFQETRTISPERVVQKGDALQLVCDYSSRGRQGFIKGGFRTTDEMCLSFVLYYPRIALDFCASGPARGSSLRLLGGILGYRNVQPISTIANVFDIGFDKFIITEPRARANTTLDAAINSYPWTKQVADGLSAALRGGPQDRICSGMAQQTSSPRYTTDPLKIDEAYLPDENFCVAPFSGFAKDREGETCDP
ncbi:DBH-like monooxygenase protein 1 homolog [Clavelina lepadiformis]|uniref:DBH-like monooxygenase protein 1 homolog n=1 Tax=Clavelina lepadiformis TaxID=159417 RepID=UPI0040413A27